MALELGLGVTPWSPLKGGALSGKYTRQNAGQIKPDRGPMVQASLHEKTYDIVDALQKIADELGTTPARVALSLVQGRPGVSSTIIGARTVAQLDDNIQALELKLAPAHVATLDALSKPTLSFPMAFLNRAPFFINGGTTVNGETGPINPNTPKSDSERY